MFEKLLSSSKEKSMNKTKKRRKRIKIDFSELFAPIFGVLFWAYIIKKLFFSVSVDSAIIFLRPDMEKAIKYIESNEEIVRDVFPSYEVNIGTVKLCQIGHWTYHTYYLKDDSLNYCRLGYGYNFQFHLDVGSVVKNTKNVIGDDSPFSPIISNIVFNQCMKLDL